MHARGYRSGQHGHCGWDGDERDEEMVREWVASDRQGGFLSLMS